jgi:hypothetical protein
VAEPKAIQSTSLFTVHEHSRLVEIVSAPVAPGASTDRGSAETLSAHRELDEGAVTLLEKDDPQPLESSRMAPARTAVANSHPRSRKPRPGPVSIQASGASDLAAGVSQSYDRTSEARRF